MSQLASHRVVLQWIYLLINVSFYKRFMGCGLTWVLVSLVGDCTWEELRSLVHKQ